MLGDEVCHSVRLVPITFGSSSRPRTHSLVFISRADIGLPVYPCPSVLGGKNKGQPQPKASNKECECMPMLERQIQPWGQVKGMYPPLGHCPG